MSSQETVLHLQAATEQQEKVEQIKIDVILTTQ